MIDKPNTTGQISSDKSVDPQQLTQELLKAKQVLEQEKQELFQEKQELSQLVQQMNALSKANSGSDAITVDSSDQALPENQSNDGVQTQMIGGDSEELADYVISLAKAAGKAQDALNSDDTPMLIREYVFTANLEGALDLEGEAEARFIKFPVFGAAGGAIDYKRNWSLEISAKIVPTEIALDDN